MNELMTQGFEELNENDLEMVDGGVDWWGVAKGVARGTYGVAVTTVCFVPALVTDKWGGVNYGVKHWVGGAKDATYALFR